MPHRNQRSFKGPTTINFNTVSSLVDDDDIESNFASIDDVSYGAYDARHGLQASSSIGGSAQEYDSPMPYRPSTPSQRTSLRLFGESGRRTLNGDGTNAAQAFQRA